MSSGRRRPEAVSEVGPMIFRLLSESAGNQPVPGSAGSRFQPTKTRQVQYTHELIIQDMFDYTACVRTDQYTMSITGIGSHIRVTHKKLGCRLIF